MEAQKLLKGELLEILQCHYELADDKQYVADVDIYEDEIVVWFKDKEIVIPF